MREANKVMSHASWGEREHDKVVSHTSWGEGEHLAANEPGIHAEPITAAFRPKARDPRCGRVRAAPKRTETHVSPHQGHPFPPNGRVRAMTMGHAQQLRLVADASPIAYGLVSQGDGAPRNSEAGCSSGTSQSGRIYEPRGC